MKVYVSSSSRTNRYDGINEEQGKECPLLKSDILNIVNDIKKNPLYSDSWDQIKKNYQKDSVKNEKNMRFIINNRNDLVKLIQRHFCRECNFNISGSASLTSDIDITVLNKETKKSHLFAFKQIKEMVNTMKCLFNNKESLLTLDINFYGHSFFFSENLGGVCKEYMKKSGEYYLPLDETMERKYRYCEAFSLLKIKKYYEECPEVIKKKWMLKFDDCKKLISDFMKHSKSGDKCNLFDYVNHDKDITQKNDKYLKQLEYIDQLSHKEIKDKEMKRYMLISEISHASIYSDESYFSYGAFMHVVYGDQMKRDISIMPPIIYIQSMLDNFGDIIKVFNHTTSKEELFSKGSKYIVRIYSAIIGYSKKKYNNKYGKILKGYNQVRELYKENPLNETMFELIRKIGISLDNIKDHVYEVYNDYVSSKTVARRSKTVARRSKTVARRSNIIFHI